MPPPDNNLYINLRGHGRTKGPGYRAYMKEFDSWILKQRVELKETQLLLQESKELGIEIFFHFDRKALYCLDGRIKKMDVTNRLKAFMDLFSKALGIDDSRFFSVTCHKVSTPDLPRVSVALFK